MGGRPVWNSGQVMQQTQAPGQYGQQQYGQPQYGQPPAMVSLTARRSLRPAAVAARSSEPRQRRRPAWSAARCWLGSIRSMMGGGGHQQQAFGDSSGLGGGSGDQKPWSDQSGSDLARDAGINDIGSSASGQRADSSDNSRAGFFDQRLER